MANPVIIAKRKAALWDYGLCLTLNRWLDQKLVHGFIDTVDLRTQFRQRGCSRCLGHGRIDRWAEPLNQRKR